MVATTTTDTGPPGRPTAAVTWRTTALRATMPDVADPGWSGRRPLRVAVVGAGPAGLFPPPAPPRPKDGPGGAGPAGICPADALAGQNAVRVAGDLVARLPTPFGLVRHGIAPDHLKMRALRETLHHTLDHERVRFVGNVEIGTDLPLDELRRHVDAVVYTYGAAGDRRLGIPGEELAGSLAATDIVAWYCGHPDADRARVEEAVVRARDVVVVGVGNVALDVARVLARSPEELHPTEMPQHVL